RLDNIIRVKTNNKERDELAELDRKFGNCIRPDRKLWLWFIKTTNHRAIPGHIILIVVMAFGVYRVITGELNLGFLYPLFAWSSKLTDNLWRVDEVERELNWITPGVLSLNEALTMEDSLIVPDNPVILPDGTPCAIEFTDVSYTYPDKTNRSKKVLDGVSLKIGAGEKIGVIGTSGAGKSTMGSLLLKNMHPSSGIIKVDGVDLAEIDTNSWLSLIGYIPQHHQIMNGTIRYNLLYGLPDSEKHKVTDEKLFEMMKLLQIDFGDRLIDGLDTKVGRNGIKLSGGQAQRLMIGSAVLKNPRFMIIDEATSSLDATTEKWVQRGLEEVLGNMGAMIITHRLNTIRRICDKFIMLSGNGSGNRIIAEATSFEELARICPEFASLASDQGLSL
ncbi:ATP-binding cassette domain-containing protein, partial [Patescibacteria group bacterium]